MKLTCILRRKPAWLKELKLSATVINKAATAGDFAKFRQSSDTPGPMKPIDYYIYKYTSAVAIFFSKIKKSMKIRSELPISKGLFTMVFSSMMRVLIIICSG